MNYKIHGVRQLTNGIIFARYFPEKNFNRKIQTIEMPIRGAKKWWG
jgi:hypothetical protein